MSEAKHTPTPWEFKPVGEVYHVTQKGHGAWFMEISMGYPSREMAYPLDAVAEFESGVQFIQTAVNSYASSQAEIARLREALTASGDTKAAYIGEFQFTVTTLELDESDEPYECQREVTVPWTTVKEIMAAILSRADAQP